MFLAYSFYWTKKLLFIQSFFLKINISNLLNLRINCLIETWDWTRTTTFRSHALSIFFVLLLWWAFLWVHNWKAFRGWCFAIISNIQGNDEEKIDKRVPTWSCSVKIVINCCYWYLIVICLFMDTKYFLTYHDSGILRLKLMIKMTK